MKVRLSKRVAEKMNRSEHQKLDELREKVKMAYFYRRSKLAVVHKAWQDAVNAYERERVYRERARIAENRYRVVSKRFGQAVHELEKHLKELRKKYV
jgi:hypothetical protein